MRSVACVVSSVLLAAALAGCASAPTKVAGDAPPTLAFAPERQRPAGEELAPQVAMLRPDQLPIPVGGLAGRTIRVERISDIRLGPREIVLTFDDGPMPGKTEKILRALDDYGVKATFLMVGQMANAYPAIARKVAERGHTVGTHTQNHSNLASLGGDRAMAQILAGQNSVAAALKPAGLRPAPFFRFPYLAETAALRANLAARNVVVIDADIDSKDYFKTGSEPLRARALSRITERGSGIVLFHDIHARTVSMLPGLLADLKARGYKVVHLVPGRGGGGLLIAGAPAEPPA